MEIRWDIPTLCLVLLAATVASFFLAAVRRSDAAESAKGGRKLFPIIAAGLGLWLVYTAQMALQGSLLDAGAMPPPFVRIIAPGLAIAFAIALSPLGGRLTRNLGYAALIGFHAFRLPLEFVLYAFHTQGRLPVQMTFAGRNFDILTGISAILVAWLAYRGKAGRRTILLWNLAGFGLLLNIMAVAILSLPGPMRAFTNEPVNELVLHFPYVWLPAVLVVAAFAGHLLLFRKLAKGP